MIYVGHILSNTTPYQYLVLSHVIKRPTVITLWNDSLLNISLAVAHVHMQTQKTETQIHSCEHVSLSPVSIFFLPYLSLSLVLSLPLEQLGQGRRSSYSFLIKLSLCHPRPQSHGGGDCWQENEAYEWVRSASDHFMGHHCQHTVEENKMFEYQRPSDVHRLQTLVQ